MALVDGIFTADLARSFERIAAAQEKQAEAVHLMTERYLKMMDAFQPILEKGLKQLEEQMEKEE